MDINTTLQDFINKNDDNNHVFDLDKVIKNIFLSCDTEGNGCVQASRIIDFVEPFLHENVEALDELKTCLIGNDNRSHLDIETFCKCMTLWTEKVANMNTNKRDSESVDTTPNMDLPRNTGYVQYGHDSPKRYGDDTVLNLSNYSTESHEHCITERLALENHIQELQYQKNQMKEDLARMRLELNNYSEQNESLQGNLDKLVKKLTNEQKLNEHLQMERRKDDALQEELSLASKQIIKLEKSISSLEKQNNQLRQHLDVVQSEKNNLEQKLQGMDKKIEDHMFNMRVLQSEIDLNQHKLVSEQETNISLLKRNQELQDFIEQCNIHIDKLKLEKEYLDKLLREQIDKNGSLIAYKTCQSINSSLHTDSDIAENESLSLDMKINDSIDEEFFNNLRMIVPNTNSVTSNLRDEMTKAATTDAHDDNVGMECDCYLRLNYTEIEKELVNLKHEIMQHENCAMIISKQNEEIESISSENTNIKEQLEKEKTSSSDLKTELLLCQDKERLMLNKCRSLEDDLKRNSDFVADIQLKLNEYTELENKSKALTQKIEELENDNSMKYVKIVNLTVEIERLRQILARTDQQNQEEVKKAINQLDEERKLHEKEKNELLQKIEALNEEKVTLQTEKDQLLTKIIELENQRCQLQTEKDELWTKQENLHAENVSVKSKKDHIKVKMAKVLNENESLQLERDLLKSENINLEIAKDEVESKLRSTIDGLQIRMGRMETERTSLLAEISTVKRDKEQLDIDIGKYAEEHTFNLKLKCQVEELSNFLEKLRKEHESITSDYTALKIQTRDEKKRITELIEDNLRMNKEIATMQDRNLELSNENNSLEKELLEYRERNNFYMEINEELDQFKNKLICENIQLVSKIDKNETSLKKMDIDNKQLGIDFVNLKLTFDKVRSTMEIYEKLNESLNLENRKFQNVIDDQKDAILKKESDLNKLRSLCQAYEQKVSALEIDLQEYQTDNANLKNELKDRNEILLQRDEKLKQIAQDKETEKREMERCNNELQKKLEEATTLLHQRMQTEKDLQSNVVEISNALNREREKQDYLTKTIVDLEMKVFEEKAIGERFKENYEKVVAESDKIKETMVKLESRIAFVEKQNEILDKEKNNLKNIAEESKKKLSTSVRCKNELAQKNRKLVEENVELVSKYDKLTEDVVKKTNSLDQANKKVDELLNDLHNAEQKVLENERDRLGFLKKEILKNKEECEKYKQENNRLRREREITVEKLRNLQDDNKNVNEQLEQLMLEKDTWLTEKISSLKNVDHATRNKGFTGFDRLAKKNMKLDNKIISLEEELGIEKRKNAEKSKELETLKEQEIRLSNEVICVKDELDKAIKNNDDLIKEVEGLINKVTDLREENESLRDGNVDLSKQIEKLAQESEESHSWKEKFDRLQEQNDNFKKDVENYYLQKICNLRDRLEMESKEQKSFEIYTDGVKDRLCEERLRLGRATLRAISAWKPCLEADFVTTAPNDGLQLHDSSHPVIRPLDEEMLQTEYQIYVTTSFLDKLTSYKDHEISKKNRHSSSFDFQDTVEQETSPCINTDVLENLGLAGDVVRVNTFSTLEMEEKFTALVLAYTIDNSSLHQRHGRQKNRLREKEQALGEEISLLSIHLEKHASDVDVSSHLERVLNLCTQISISAERFGSLNHQVNLSKAMELMVNYVARLRKSLDAQPREFLCIQPSQVKICRKNQIGVEIKDERKVTSFDVAEDIPSSDVIEKKPWITETHFMLTISIAVLLVVILFNTFENCHTTFDYSPVIPPT